MPPVRFFENILKPAGWVVKLEGESMSIEGIPDIDVDTLSEPNSVLSAIEEKHQNLVTLHSSIDSLERVISLLMALRSANVSAILSLKKGTEALEDEELQYLFKYLRDW